MFEYLILYCLVTGLGDSTQARCHVIEARSNKILENQPKLCMRAARLRENNLRWLHYEKFGFENAPAFVADHICQEHPI